MLRRRTPAQAALYTLDIYAGLAVSRAVELPAGQGCTAMACGALLAVGCEDGCVRLYDAAMRRCARSGRSASHTGRSGFHCSTVSAPYTTSTFCLEVTGSVVVVEATVAALCGAFNHARTSSIAGECGDFRALVWGRSPRHCQPERLR